MSNNVENEERNRRDERNEAWKIVCCDIEQSGGNYVKQKNKIRAQLIKLIKIQMSIKKPKKKHVKIKEKRIKGRERKNERSITIIVKP